MDVQPGDAQLPRGSNHALLIGEVQGALMACRLDVEMVMRGENYTDTLKVNRPSGAWLVRVSPENVSEL
jgi:hypothetical protein